MSSMQWPWALFHGTHCIFPDWTSSSENLRLTLGLAWRSAYSSCVSVGSLISASDLHHKWWLLWLLAINHSLYSPSFASWFPWRTNVEGAWYLKLGLFIICSFSYQVPTVYQTLPCIPGVWWTNSLYSKSSQVLKFFRLSVSHKRREHIHTVTVWRVSPRNGATRWPHLECFSALTNIQFSLKECFR